MPQVARKPKAKRGYAGMTEPQLAAEVVKNELLGLAPGDTPETTALQSAIDARDDIDADEWDARLTKLETEAGVTPLLRSPDAAPFLDDPEDVVEDELS